MPINDRYAETQLDGVDIVDETRKFNFNGSDFNVTQGSNSVTADISLKATAEVDDLFPLIIALG
jgi:hypothetical protein